MQRKDLLVYARERLGLQIVPWASDVDGLVSLTRSIYPASDIADPQYITWEYEKNPAGPGHVQLGKLNQDVAGAFALIPLRFQIDGQTMMGSLSINTMTHPSYRGLGVFPLLAESVMESARHAGLEFILTYPNPLSYKGFIKDSEFKELGHVPLWVLPLKMLELARSEPLRSRPIVRKLVALLAPAVSLYSVFFHLLFRAQPFEISEVRVIDDSFTIFWEKVRSGYLNAVVRDRAYLHWRFMTHPTRSYRIFSATRGGAMKGFIVTRVDQVLGIRSGLIVDLLIEKSTEGEAAAQALIQRATALFKEQGAILAAGLMQNAAAGAKALRRVGYCPCPKRLLPQPFAAILRWNSESAQPSALYDFKKWYLTMGDYDAV